MHVNALLLHQDLMYLIFFNILNFFCVWTLEIMVAIMLQLSIKVWVLHITSSLCWFDKSEVTIDKCRLNLATNAPFRPLLKEKFTIHTKLVLFKFLAWLEF
jgi:hypothetical protein